MFAAIGTSLAPDHGCFKAINCQLEKPPLPCCDKAREEGSIRSIKEEEDDDGLSPFNLGSPVGDALILNSVDVEERVVVPTDDDEEEEEEERETADAVAATAAAATYSSTSCTSAK